MASPRVPLIIRPVHDRAYTVSRHTEQGAQVLRDFARGRSAHVFNKDLDLQTIEEKVWTEGSYQGRTGKGQRHEWERFVWCAPFSIGKRIQKGKGDVPLYWVEIKGKIIRGDWVYHLAPRSKPA